MAFCGKVEQRGPCGAGSGAGIAETVEVMEPLCRHIKPPSLWAAQEGPRIGTCATRMCVLACDACAAPVPMILDCARAQIRDRRGLRRSSAVLYIHHSTTKLKYAIRDHRVTVARPSPAWSPGALFLPRVARLLVNLYQAVHARRPRRIGANYRRRK